MTLGDTSLPIETFMWERAAHLFERRGFKSDEIRVVAAVDSAWSNVHKALRRLEAIARARSSPDFEALAVLFKRVKNITKGVEDGGVEFADLRPILVEPAELALVDDLERRFPLIYSAQGAGDYVTAMTELAKLQNPVNRFFVDVLVMADDVALRDARLAVLTRLRTAVLKHIGDIAEIAPDEAKQA